MLYIKVKENLMATIFLLTKGAKFIIPHLSEKRNNVISVKWGLRIPIDPAKRRSTLGKTSHRHWASGKMRTNKKPGPRKLPKSVEFRKFIPTVAIGQVHHKVLRAKQEVKNK